MDGISDVLGVVLATNTRKLADGTLALLANVDGAPILERAIETHLRLWPTVVVVEPALADIIWHGLGEIKHDDKFTFCVRNINEERTEEYLIRKTEEGLVECICSVFRQMDAKPKQIVISMGNQLWSERTLAAVLDCHRSQVEGPMTMAVVNWKAHREIFWRHGVVVYDKGDIPLPKTIKEVWQCWPYPGSNGIPGANGDVCADLFCFGFDWFEISASGGNANFPLERQLHGLVAKLHDERRPAVAWRLPDEQALEALDPQSDDDLEYVREQLQALSPQDTMPDAAARFATEYVEVARAV